MKADAKQIQLIHIAKSQCRLSEDEYRAVIAGHALENKSSSKDLTYSEANAVINYFIKTLHCYGMSMKTVKRIIRENVKSKSVNRFEKHYKYLKKLLKKEN